MGPLELLQNRGMEGLGRYYGVYRAVVVNNQDSNHQGKIQVSIPYIQSGIKVWASSKSNAGGVGYGFKFLTPPVGEFVWVEFEFGDPLRPVWSYHPWARGECPKDLQATNTIGLVTPKGHKILLKEDEDIFSLQLEEGSSLFIEKGKITLNTPDGGKVTIEGKKVILNDGNNGSLVNSSAIKSLAQAILTDLTPLGSVVNITKWISSDMLTKLEDNNVTH